MSKSECARMCIRILTDIMKAPLPVAISPLWIDFCCEYRLSNDERAQCGLAFVSASFIVSSNVS